MFRKRDPQQSIFSVAPPARREAPSPREGPAGRVPPRRPAPHRRGGPGDLCQEWNGRPGRDQGDDLGAGFLRRDCGWSRRAPCEPAGRGRGRTAARATARVCLGPERPRTRSNPGFRAGFRCQIRLDNGPGFGVSCKWRVLFPGDGLPTGPFSTGRGWHFVSGCPGVGRLYGEMTVCTQGALAVPVAGPRGSAAGPARPARWGKGAFL
jgi:hypothetical protein